MHVRAGPPVLLFRSFGRSGAGCRCAMLDVAVIHARQRVPIPGRTQGGHACRAPRPRGRRLRHRDLAGRGGCTDGPSDRRVHTAGEPAARPDHPALGGADGLDRPGRVDASDGCAIRHARVTEPHRDASADGSPEADALAHPPPNADPDPAAHRPPHRDAGTLAVAAKSAGATRLANEWHGRADLRHGRSRR